MNTESILSTLLAAAAFLKHALEDVASQSIKDAYVAAKTYLLKKFGANAEATRALEMATDKPESLLRKGVLAEETTGCELERDVELARLIETLASLLPAPTSSVQQDVRVSGHGNRVQVAGRDLGFTERLIRRNAITPDGRHLTVEQRERLREVIRELAERLTGPNGRGGISAVHAMLQRRFSVASYLLLPREKLEEALSFLKQQRAIHRSRLRDRDPVAYQNDLYRAIFAGARELGWDGGALYRFAGEKLGLNLPLGSLKELGSVQLKTLMEFIQREVRSNRDGAKRGIVLTA